MHLTRGDRVLCAARATNFRPSKRDNILTSHHEELNIKAIIMEQQLQKANLAADKADAERLHQESIRYRNNFAPLNAFPMNPFGINQNNGFIDYQAGNNAKKNGSSTIKPKDLFGTGQINQGKHGTIKTITSETDVTTDPDEEDSGFMSTIQSDADAISQSSDATTSDIDYIIPKAQYVSLTYASTTSVSIDDVAEDPAIFMTGWTEAITTFQTVVEDAKIDLFTDFVKLIKDADEYQLGKVTVDV
jgi:hypothetical protein